MTVTSATVASLRFEPVTASIAAGTTQPFLVRAIFSDNSQQDVTPSATLLIQEDTVAQLTTIAGEVRGRAPGNTAITANYGGETARANLAVTPAILRQIEVTPNAPHFPNGTQQTFTATGIYSDSTTQNLTSSVAWSTTDPSIVVIESNGLATANALGTTDVLATLGSVRVSVTVSVTDAVPTQLRLDPATIAMPKGLSQQLVATVTLSDGSFQDVTSQTSFDSTSPEVVTVANFETRGLVTGRAEGTATVGGRYGALQAATTVTISPAVLRSLQVAPDSSAVPLGLSQAFSAQGTFSDDTVRDLTGQVAWTSSQPEVAEVNGFGRAVALSEGETTVRATINANSASAVVTVTPAQLSGLRLAPSSATLAFGQNLKISAFATFTDGSEALVTPSISFVSSSPEIAKITGDMVYAQAGGEVSISANFGGFTGQAQLTILSPTSGPWLGFLLDELLVMGKYVDYIQLDDLDGDGDLDLLSSDRINNLVYVRKNNGKGEYDTAINYPAGKGPGRIVAGDLNGDGRKDLVVANMTTGFVTVLLATGPSTFSAPKTTFVDCGGSSLALGDVDRDADSGSLREQRPGMVLQRVASGSLPQRRPWKPHAYGDLLRFFLLWDREPHRSGRRWGSRHFNP